MSDGLRMGGLMRCCLETIEDLYPDGPALIGTEGQELQCKYAPDSPDHQMIFKDGAWQWGRAAHFLEAQMTNAPDPTPEQIEAEHPAWHVWQGVSGLWYAARGRSSPAVVLREENTVELRAAVASWERVHAPEAGRTPG